MNAKTPAQDRGAWEDDAENDGPLTHEEREYGLTMLAELRRFQAELLADRDGVAFGRSRIDLAEARDERIRELG